MGAEFFHVDTRTNKEADTTKLIIAFRDVANLTKNGHIHY
jgi:hypothetical protein